MSTCDFLVAAIDSGDTATIVGAIVGSVVTLLARWLNRKRKDRRTK